MTHSMKDSLTELRVNRAVADSLAMWSHPDSSERVTKGRNPEHGVSRTLIIHCTTVRMSAVDFLLSETVHVVAVDGWRKECEEDLP